MFLTKTLQLTCSATCGTMKRLRDDKMISLRSHNLPNFMSRLSIFSDIWSSTISIFVEIIFAHIRLRNSLAALCFERIVQRACGALWWWNSHRRFLKTCWGILQQIKCLKGFKNIMTLWIGLRGTVQKWGNIQLKALHQPKLTSC